MFRIADFVHARVFGYGMSSAMCRFLEHLSWSFFGVFVAIGLVSVVNVVAGRLLGPVEYGRYALIVSVATIFIIPMTFGLDVANTYYIAKSKVDEEKNRYIATTLLVSLGLIMASVGIISFFSTYIAWLFSVDTSLLYIILVFSIFLVLRNIADSIIKGLHVFQFQALVRVGEAVMVTVAFFVFLRFDTLFNFRAYVFAMVVGYMFYTFFALWKTRRRIGFSFNRAREMISYGKFAITGSIATVVFYSVDKILVNRYLGVEQLGLYNAYQTFSFLLVAQFSLFFINVFFPYMASLEDTSSALKKLNQLGILLFVPVFLMLLIILRLALALLGGKYSFDWILACEFSFLATISAYYYGLWWLINSKSKSGIRFTSFHGIIAGTLFIACMILLRQYLTLYSVVACMIGVFLYMIIVGNLNFKRILS